jgi:hypothetical protein
MWVLLCSELNLQPEQCEDRVLDGPASGKRAPRVGISSTVEHAPQHLPRTLWLCHVRHVFDDDIATCTHTILPNANFSFSFIFGSPNPTSRNSESRNLQFIICWQSTMRHLFTICNGLFVDNLQFVVFLTIYNASSVNNLQWVICWQCTMGDLLTIYIGSFVDNVQWVICWWSTIRQVADLRETGNMPFNICLKLSRDAMLGMYFMTYIHMYAYM